MGATRLTMTTIPAPKRVQSIDILRGAIMVLMAIDHVRVYSGLPAVGPDPGIFFTRWVTHFCAPGFVFFAGTAAFLYGQKIGDTKILQRYLITRGLLLVFLELTLIRFGWTFNFNYGEFTLAGVIWMLGCCMVLMALFIRLRPVVIGGIGLGIIFFQQLFSLVPRTLPDSLSVVKSLWEFIYTSGNEPPTGITILYVLVPWIGVMLTGYGFGAILLLAPEKRNRLCIRIGAAAIIIFGVVGTIVILISPVQPESPPFIFRLLNQQKYPASQLFLLMTIGPLLALIPWTEKAHGKIADALTIFGKVPFFYYLLHIPLIHVSALLVNFFVDGTAHQEWYATAPFVWVPDEAARWSLSLLYFVFVIDVVMLYFSCRWYMRYKFSHPENKWLKYV